MTGIFLCSCLHGICRRKDAERAAGTARVFEGDLLCTARGVAAMAAEIRGAELDRVLVLGCGAAQSDAVNTALRKATGLGPGAVAARRLGPRTGAEDRDAAVRSALASLALVPEVKTRKAKPRQDVLVIGSGEAARAAAEALAVLGREAAMADAGSLTSFSGHAGRYAARLRGPQGETEREFGAVIAAPDLPKPSAGRKPFVSGKVIPLSGLQKRLSGLSRREFPAAVAVILDMTIDETKAGFGAACRACLDAKALRPVETYVFLRDARVAAPGLEDLYDKARDAGVQFVKYEGRIRLDAVEGGVRVRAKDTVLGEDVEISCGLAAVSELGLATPADPALAQTLGLDTDALGRLQENNIRLLPELSNRGGIFLAGSCRGATYGPDAVRDARNAALSAHALLSRPIETELSHAVVDGDKCALCLTCIRLCPFRAMAVNAEEKQAECVPESCRHCGICAGECPNKAITLPLWSDAIVLAQAGAALDAAPGVPVEPAAKAAPRRKGRRP